jgi:signal transduction histidine kinase
LGRLGSRAALIAGFGALLVLMAMICVDALLTLRAFEANNVQIQQEFLYRERTLEQVRSGLHESGSIVLEFTQNGSDPAIRQKFLADLESIQNETTGELQSCIRSLPADKRAPFGRLDTELQKYWATTRAIFELPAGTKNGPNSADLRSSVLSQHSAVLAITKEVSQVNDDELKEVDRRIGEVFARFRLRLSLVAAVTFTCGLSLAGATILYAGRLEESVEEKYRESLRAREELKQLSRRLVEAEENERRSISRELHDEVGQTLGALLLDIENLAESPAEGAPLRERLKNIKTLAENCVNEVRNMSLLLRPSMLDDLGLVPALEWQAREVSKRTGMIVDTVEENVSDNLPDEYRTCVYRIVQEALNNCSKHSEARQVRILVRQEPKNLYVSIEDDGKGFDSARVRGMGLVGMNERVNQLGGTLKVDSNAKSGASKGTRIQVDLPLLGESV